MRLIRAIEIATELNQFAKSFSVTDLKLGFETFGLFGYTSYNAIPLFENIEFTNQDFDLPLIQYHLFRYTIVFNHFNNELFLLEHLQENEVSNLSSIQDIINNRSVTQFKISTQNQERDSSLRSE